MKLGVQVGLGPGHIVFDGDPAPTAAPTHFRPMPIVAKWSPISATAELLLFNLKITRTHNTLCLITVTLFSDIEKQ